MCGICGIITPQPDPELLRSMCQTLRHRGPDDEGYYWDESAGLAMRRLSIIDLDSGQQPIHNEDHTLHLVFNGEIYNYRALRHQLQQKGHIFRTQSDSEVIVHAYEEWGAACLQRLNGMFGLAIWDTKSRSLFLARDRLGIKPLYYWVEGERLIFGSELKAIIADRSVPRVINPLALDHYLTYEYIPAPHAIFEGIHKLPAGHWLRFEAGNLQIESYWDVPLYEMHGRWDSAEKLKTLLHDAIRLRMISDVPLGAFLSGGIDSSTIVALMSQLSNTPVRTFSIGFGDPTYNELPQARAVAQQFQTQHHERTLQPDIVALAQKLIAHLDEPLADFSILPTFLVSQLAREHVTVVLSGDGGDELLGGYDTYRAQQMARYYDHLPRQLRQQWLPQFAHLIPPQPAKKGALNKIKRFVEGAALHPDLQHTRWMTFMTAHDKSDLLTFPERVPLHAPHAAYFQQAAHSDPLKQQQYVDVKTYLVENILTKVDRMSMAASLEARTPFLDHRVVEFAINLPPHLKLNGNTTKAILRHAMQDQLPAVVLNKPKQGFSIPLKHWLRTTMRELLLDTLATPSPYFNKSTIQRWTTEHLSGKVNHSHRLWALLVFEQWLDTNKP